jgi:hypothetical protein
MPAAHHPRKSHATPLHLGKRRLQLPLNCALHRACTCSENHVLLTVSLYQSAKQRLSHRGEPLQEQQW